ncbi:MAG: hypothetical protein LBC08_01740, partial [Campylobacteraceae bacterium]|nr:hypothetical protein [Campylobacteraceae bacterium]
VNTLENFKRFPNISPHHASLLNAFQNVLRGESNGVNLKFRIKTKDEGAIKTAVQNMIIKRTVDTDVFDVEISNL